MTFRELINKEHKEVKARMIKETNGTYILLYLLNGFMVFLMCMFGLLMKKEDEYIIVLLGSMIFMVLEIGGRFMKQVGERNKRVNLFEKYKYIPIDMKQLVKAKMVVFFKYTYVQIIVGQILAILLRIWNPDHVRQENICLLFMPLYIGVVLYIYEYISMTTLTKKVL